MQLAANLPDSLLETTMNHAVAEVFSTMTGFATTVLPTEEFEPEISLDAPHVVGTVGFIGEIKGLIYLYLKTDFAEACAGRMLDMDAAELTEAGDEVVNDAIGELTNMTVGTFKNQLADQGMPCRLTIPSIMRGSHFQVEPILAASRRVFRFQLGRHILTVDLMMQSGE